MDILSRLFKLSNLPIITPYNLLDNAKLDNYEYVKYYKKENKFITYRCVASTRKFSGATKTA